MAALLLLAQTKPAPSISLAVPGDHPIEVAIGPFNSAQVIVYLHGVCGDPNAFESWAPAATKRATFISLRGDLTCKNASGADTPRSGEARTKWSYDYKKNDKRIAQAIAVADVFRQAIVDSIEVTPLSRDDVTLMGYSQGASRVSMLAYRFPKRYRRVALIAQPREPNLGQLYKSERILLVAGGWDARKHIYEGYKTLDKNRKVARYLELPRARHGEYGPKALEFMGKGLDWLFEKQKLP